MRGLYFGDEGIDEVDVEAVKKTLTRAQAGDEDDAHPLDGVRLSLHLNPPTVEDDGFGYARADKTEVYGITPMDEDDVVAVGGEQQSM